MKTKIITPTVRWILVLPAMFTTFFIGLSTVNQPSGLWAFVCLIIAFLTGIMVAPLHGKRFFTVVASLFILSCLFPPWQGTVDTTAFSRGGGFGSEPGVHSRKPAGYSLLFDPPTQSADSGVQIDFGRLFLEWAALATVTGMVWVLVVKPAWSRDDKANHPA